MIQLSEEHIEVGKRAVNRGTTRLRRYTVETPIEENVRLREETVSIERRPVSGTAAVGPDAFTDRVIEVTETREEAVVAKTARVKEEVVIHKDVNERVETVRDTVRRDEVEVEKVPGTTRTTEYVETTESRPARSSDPRAPKILTARFPSARAAWCGPGLRAEKPMSTTQPYGGMPNGRLPSEGGSLAYETERHFDSAHIHRRISWPALFAAVFVAIAIELMLSILGVAVGLGFVSPEAGATPHASSLGIGAGVWWFVSTLIAFGIGGFVAAWLAGITARFDGVLHGVVTWAIATMVVVYLLTTALGGLLGGAFSLVGSGLSAAGAGVKAAAPQVAQAAGVTPEMLQGQAQAYLQPTDPDPATMSPQDAQKAIATELPTYVAGGAGAAAAKDRIIAIMAAQMKVSKDDATKRFDQLQARATQTKNQAIQTTETAATTSAGAASTGSYLIFGVLLLDLIAAAIGGSLAVQRRTLLTERVGPGQTLRG